MLVCLWHTDCGIASAAHCDKQQPQLQPSQHYAHALAQLYDLYSHTAMLLHSLLAVAAQPRIDAATLLGTTLWQMIICHNVAPKIVAVNSTCRSQFNLPPVNSTCHCGGSYSYAYCSPISLQLHLFKFYRYAVIVVDAVACISCAGGATGSWRYFAHSIAKCCFAPVNHPQHQTYNNALHSRTSTRSL